MPSYYVQGAAAPFSQQLEVFVTQAQAAFDSVTQTGQRKWATPYVGVGWNLDVLNYTGANSIGSAFDRTLLNSKYWEAVINGPALDDTYGKIAETRCAKYQIDALAAMERAFRECSRSYVRAAYATAARNQGHANEQGPIRDIVAVVNRMITQADVDQLPPQKARIDTEQAFADIDSSSAASVGAFV